MFVFTTKENSIVTLKPQNNLVFLFRKFYFVNKIILLKRLQIKNI